MAINAEHGPETGVTLELRSEPECQYPAMDEHGQLYFRYGSPGKRHYLCDEPVHAGDLLEMCLDDGAWECVRYEYSWNPDTQVLKAFLHLSQDQCVPLPENARFRWPKRG